jgi:hypothetical protein
MCSVCFEDNIFAFKDDNSFLIVWNKIKKNLENRKFTYLGNFGGKIIPLFKIGQFGFGGTSTAYYRLYLCNNCGKKWKLAYPENFKRGFLIMDIER